MTTPEKTGCHVMQLISQLGFGGAERLAMTISDGLATSGFKVSVCGFFGGEGPLAEDLARREIPFYYLEAESKSYYHILKDLFRLLKNQRVTVLQVHGIYPLMKVFLSAKLAGVKIIYTEHAKYSICKYKKLAWAAKILPLFVEKVVCVSGNLRQFFRRELRVPDSKIELIYNGVDVDRFTAAAKGSDDLSPGKPFVVGTVARISAPKDHANLLKAFQLVMQKRADVKLVLVGDGELKAEIEALIEDLKLDRHVVLLGSRNDIPELLAAMDVFVLPSKREGFPVSILEAMAAGRPVVATDVGGVAEIIDSGKNGLIVPAENSEALADAIDSMIENYGWARTMGQNALATVQQKFSINGMIRDYRSLMLEIIDSERG